MKKIKKVALLLAVVLLTSMLVSITATAATHTERIELVTRSILLIDKSGSMDDQQKVDEILCQYDLASYDAVRYFDHRISANPDFVGGGDSHICEAIDAVARGGFTHITVVTDGEQWPQNYETLGVYSDLNLTIHLVEEEDKESKEFLSKVKEALEFSNLTVVNHDGTEEVILNDYKAPIYSIEVPDSYENNEGENNIIINEGDEYVCNCDCCKCKHISWSWWWFFLLLLPILGLLLWWLFRNWKVARRIKNAHAVVDCSNSMAKVLKRLYRVCRQLGVSANAEIIRFGQGASLEKLEYLKDVYGENATFGTEGLQLAIDQGWEEIVLISDLGFNGKEVSSLNGRFKKISVVVPRDYEKGILEEIKKIADEIEVIHL